MDPQELGGHTPIEAIQFMSPKSFADKYSANTPPPGYFADKVGYFTTNETDYPDSLKIIRVRGGIHLAIMGGVDPVLGQIAVAAPDLTIMSDINQSSIEVTTEGRIDPLLESQNAQDYWNKVGDFFREKVRKIDPKRWDFPIDLDSTKGGWSSHGYFPVVKDAVVKGRVKWAAGDFIKDGIELGLRIARETDTPVRLIYVSNIFDYSQNNKGDFAKKLAQGIEDGLIDPNAQIIDTSTKEGLQTQVFDISTFISASLPR